MKLINLPKTRPWWQVFLLLLMLHLADSNPTWATTEFNDSRYTKIVGKPANNNGTYTNSPYFELEMIYYDWQLYENSFWAAAPEIYVDGVKVCTGTEIGQFALSGKRYGNAELADQVDDKFDSWWGDPHEKTQNGVTYRVWFRDPFCKVKQTNKTILSCYMRVYISSMESGTNHSVEIKGKWRNEKDATDKDVDVTWTFNAPTMWTNSNAPTCNMTDYNHLTASGTLNSDYGPTVVGFYSNDAGSAPNSFVETANLMSRDEYPANTSSFSNQSAIHNRSDQNQKNGSTAAIEYVIPKEDNGFTTYFYKWFNVSVPGFVAPQNLSAEDNQWAKSITLVWDKQEAGKRCKEGTWSIFRNDTLIVDNLAYGTSKYTNTQVPDYDKNYKYKVAFVPKNSPSGATVNSLTDTLTAMVKRQWSFTSFEGALVDDDAHIKLTWKHNAIKDATGNKTYVLSIYRSGDGGQNWGSAIYTTNITSSSTTEGSYTDTQDLQGNHTYTYKLEVNLLEKDFSTDPLPVTLGGSQLKDFSASRGNYSNVVKLSWTVKQVGVDPTSFAVDRRPLGSNNEKEWATIHTTSGTGSAYGYDDNTAEQGKYYEYRVSIIDNGNSSITYGFKTTDGFTYSTGVISGRIKYGTGTAVEGVKVKLKQQSADGDLTTAGMRSLQFKDAGSGMGYYTDNDEIQQLLGGDFSVQMWVKPLKAQMEADGQDYLLFDVDNVFAIRLWYHEADDTYRVGGWIGADEQSSIFIPADKWSHLTFIHSKADATTKVIVATPDTIKKATILNKKTIDWTDNTASEANSIAIGNSGGMNYAYNYGGYMDEIRFFTKALTEKEVERNYNHPLAGNESGLAIYYPFDEGLREQSIAYDYSKTNGVSNGRHGRTGVTAYSSTDVPSEEQMCMMNYTDSLGNYTIRGIHFQGEGTAYSVIPEYNIHEFSPSAKSCFISSSSLVHSGIDFEDVSSFPVSGKIFYAGTDYPVEGVSFYVDGTICSKDGKMVTTDENGEFTISVPIGEHFIRVEKNGHEFANDGRYPADPANVGTRYTFNRKMNDLEFIDETLVNFAGRVVGGDIEGEKTIGFGLSNNNIGVAELVLTPLNTVPRMNVVKVVTETSYSYETNTETVDVASASPIVKSTSWRGEGNDNCRKIIIRTDPSTGEFSAMIPPLQYQIDPIKVVKGELRVGEPTVVDLSNPLISFTDTLFDASGAAIDEFTYNTLLRQTYHSTPTFNVVQNDHTDGAFGISSYKMLDQEGQLNISDIYSLDADGKPVYKYYGAAIFEMDEPYTFNIEAFEEYENSDGDTPVTDHVPLANLVVTIDNALSSEQAVYVEDGTVNGNAVTAGQVVELQENQLQLDSLGCATYTWKAGLPNISGDYTRTIAMSYEVGGRHYQWSGSGMKGIILGSMPTGNNFVTAGPDMLDMILRDPPGTASSAEWSSGKVTSKSKTKMGTWSSDTHVTTLTKLTYSNETITGTPSFAVINNIDAVNEFELGLLIKVEGEAGDTWSRTVETTKTIATSDAQEYVGAQGDVFIGTATNIIFGKARNLGFHRIGSSNEVELNLSDILTTGLSFGTEFSYTQNYIENELIPNLEALRNSMLRTVSDVNGHTCDGDNPIYLTTLSPGDVGYGENNPPYIVEFWGYNHEVPCSDGPSYKMVVPKENECYQDSVMWCNTQIAAWKRYLALNEEQKVRAYELRNYKDSVEYRNFSFDSGASVTNSVEIEESNSYKYDAQVATGVHLNNNWGIKINNTGVIFDVGTETTGGYHTEDESSTSEKTTFSYTLKEEGGGDALTVDVYKYGAFGPIFRTRGGQTSAPYEGKVETKYYDPGTTIMDATMQIEVPQIDVDVPTVSDVPTGQAASYTLRLGNASETGDDVAYKLFVLDETNPDGAQLSIDGKVLTDGRLIKVPGNQTLTKTLQLRQTDISMLDYEGNLNPDHDLFKRGIGIVFASESQPEEIADTVFIKAYFTPSSSPVELALSNTTINTQTGTNLTLKFSGFDRNYRGLKAFRLQYKQQGATDWIQLKEYVLSAPTASSELLPATGASVSYTLPMESFPDGDYLFRVVSVATYGADEVYKYSDEMALVKDVMKPRPLGIPEPADGVLDTGDELSVSFNERILRGELTKSANFLVTGVLNGAEVAHETALSLNSGSSAAASAQTQASINLANKDFSIDTWVKITGAGTLLSHGKSSEKLTVGTNADGKLVVTIAGNTYVSTNSVPYGKWAFLTMNVTADGKLSASVATADETDSLFTDKEVAAYTGNGPVSVGCGASAAMHELLIWDEAHDMTTALMNRSKTKTPSTRNLIGYWKMDEGEGASIRDYARSRHMTMVEETWYLNNENKAVALDGEHYVSINTSMLPTTPADDYTVEFWMRCDAQTGNAQLMQIGNVALWLNSEGQLQLTGKDAYSPTEATTIATTSGILTDKAWHHVALNVLRQGAASVYVDGNRCLTTNAANVGAINGDKLLLGVRRTTNMEVNEIQNDHGETVRDTFYVHNYDRLFHGQVDEVRVWCATMNSSQIAKNRKIRFTGTEPGLMAYYPFETKVLDDYNQVVTIGTPTDLTGSGLSAELKSPYYEDPALTYVDNAPALRSKPTETNVNFSFVASDEKIVIEIDEDPATIEGCTLNFTVKSVRDENGNYSDPVVWSAFVSQNELVWAEDELIVEKELNSEGCVTATIMNKGGKQQAWTLNGMPSWLTASPAYGTTNPRSQTEVTFYVAPSAPLGHNEATVYLSGNDGIETPLTISLKVTGDEPLWTVDASDYEESMNVIGNLYLLDIMSEDEEDLVGAFIGDECRGVARPVYNSRYDSYFVTMIVYGNISEVDTPVEFKAYDASTGIIYPVVRAYMNGETTATDVTFTTTELLGRYGNPVKLSATEEMEQNIELGKGWNWMSIGVKPEVFTVDNVFSKADDKAEYMKSYNGQAEFNGTRWVTDINSLNNREMYAVQTNSDFILSVTGYKLKNSEEPITVKNGWSWVAFNPLTVMSLEYALADMQPQNDDIIKGQHGVAYYDSYEWTGNLTQLVPGHGYKIRGQQARTFTYPEIAEGAGRQTLPEMRHPEEPTHFTPVDYHNYPTNMVLIAKVMKDGEPLTNVETGVFADDECREAAITNEKGLIIITIPGDEATKLNFRIFTGGEELEAAESIIYETDAVVGKPSAPFIINLGNTTGIYELTNGSDLEDVYDLQGRKVQFDNRTRKLSKGVFIVNGKKIIK